MDDPDLARAPGQHASPDYAEPVRLSSSRRRGAGPRPVRRLWDGPGRRALRAGCLGLSLLLAVVLSLTLLADRPGAASPEQAVATLLQGIADLDGPAIVGVVAPGEVADAERADRAYSRLGERVLRVGEVPPVEVDRVLLAAEDQLSGAFSRQALAVLAAVDLDLDGLGLVVEALDEATARVSLRGGVLAVGVDTTRLPGDAVIEAGTTGRAGYDMALADGWERDGQRIVASLVTVQVDGRWFVSLEASADDLLGAS